MNVVEKTHTDMMRRISTVVRRSHALRVYPFPFLEKMTGGKRVFAIAGSRPYEVDATNSVYFPGPVVAIVHDQFKRNFETVPISDEEFNLRGDFCIPLTTYKRTPWRSRRVKPQGRFSDKVTQ